MTFFARPNLDNIQFKQLSGSTLSLSGQTQISTTTGLTLSDGHGGNVIITATGSGGVSGQTGQVLAYDGVGRIRLVDVIGGGGSGNYSYSGDTTCTVGGMTAGTNLFDCKIDYILHQILSPTISPTLTPNSASLFLSPSRSVFELGEKITFTASTTYCAGTVSPNYCGGPTVRTGNPTCYTYTDFGGTSTPVIGTTCNNTHQYSEYTIKLGNQYSSVDVSYSAGLYPLNSDGSIMTGKQCPSGTITSPVKTISGVLPWYWGKSMTRNINGTHIVTGCCESLTKNPNNTIDICFDSGPNDYLWFAVPANTTPKTCWYVNGTNNGAINGTLGQTFAKSIPMLASSPQGRWTNCLYDVYITCLQTGTDYGVPMCFY